MIKLPFAILNPVTQPPRLHAITHLGSIDDLSVLDEIVNAWDGHTPMAFDFETRGDVHLPDSRVVTVAISDNRGTVTIDFRGGNPHAYPYLFEILHKAGVPLLAHNAYFDAAWIFRDLLIGKDGKVSYNPKFIDRYCGPEAPFKSKLRLGATPFWYPVTCTYATYRHLANEGWVGQQYGLAKAQIDLLNWEESNKDEVARWLSVNGFRKSNLAKRIDVALAAGEALSEEDEASLIRVADKSHLWQVPYEVLGPYNALDADSTWLIWTYVLEPALSKFDALRKWMTVTYPAFTRLLVEQKLRGIQLDMEYLVSYKEALEKKAQLLKEEFRAHPEVASFIQEKEESVRAEYRSKEPSRYTKSSELPPEPKRLTTKGSVTSNWLKWDAKRRQLESAGRPLSKNWVDWNAKMTELDETEQFSLTSPLDLRWLFYDKLGAPVTEQTESGEPSIAGDVLEKMGGAAEILSRRVTVVKEETYVQSVFDVSPFGVLHPQVRLPGTHTFRLSGAGGLNVQNWPKSPILRTFKSRPGFKLITADVASLEQVVLTELSQDPSLMKLYGPEAKPGNDVYLFNASQIDCLKGPVLEAGYDPDNFTRESVNAAKKLAKKSRDIAKVVTLSASYGAGPGKIYETLTGSGVEVSLEECREAHAQYWQLYGGVKRWEKVLMQEWRKNKGWLLNGLGQVITIHPDYTKDIVNRVCQSTGHSVFVLFLLESARQLTEKGIEWYPWNADIHDCYILEVREEDCERACELISGPIAESWNRDLGGLIKLRADPNVVTSFFEDKITDEKEIETLDTFFGLRS